MPSTTFLGYDDYNLISRAMSPPESPHAKKAMSHNRAWSLLYMRVWQDNFAILPLSLKCMMKMCRKHRYKTVVPIETCRFRSVQTPKQLVVVSALNSSRNTR